MGHVQYAQWAQSIQKILKRHKIAPHMLLELGAGTCRLAPWLSIPSLQQRVHTDLSLDMLRQAEADFPYSRVTCNATTLPFSQKFDWVLMCYDAANYLSEQALQTMFAEIYRVLLPGGIFLFDVTTEENSLQWFEDYVDAFETSGGLLLRRSSYDAEHHEQHNFFDLFTPASAGLYERKQEHHIQYIYPILTLCSWLNECDFVVVDLLDAQNLRPAREKSERVQILATRKRT